MCGFNRTQVSVTLETRLHSNSVQFCSVQGQEKKSFKETRLKRKSIRIWKTLNIAIKKKVPRCFVAHNLP